MRNCRIFAAILFALCVKMNTFNLAAGGLDRGEKCERIFITNYETAKNRAVFM